MQDLHAGTSTELWQNAIRDAARLRAMTLDEHEESYLGFVLQRHQRDAQFAARTLALDWLQAQNERGQVRADALRDVGDRCLLIAGLFPQLARRRRVTPAYFLALGRDAYAGVATCARDGYATLFRQLAAAFERLVCVLGGLRNPQLADPPLSDDFALIFEQSVPVSPSTHTQQRRLH